MSVDIDEAEVKLLQENLNKLRSECETSNIHLKKISTEINNIESALNPIMNLTSTKRTAVANLESTLDELNKLGRISAIVLAERRIIDDTTGNVPVKRIIDSIDKLSAALQDAAIFKSIGNTTVPNNISALIEKGSKRVGAVLQRAADANDPETVTLCLSFFGKSGISYYIDARTRHVSYEIEQIINSTSQKVTDLLACAQTLIRRSASEREILRALNLDIDPDEIAARIIEPAFNILYKAISANLSKARTNIRTNGLYAVQAHAAITYLTDSFHSALKNSTGFTHELVRVQGDAAKMAYDAFPASILYFNEKLAAHTNFPSDAGVVEPCSELVSRLRAISSVKAAAIIVAEELGVDNIIPSPPPAYMSTFTTRNLLRNKKIRTGAACLSTHLMDLIECFVVNLINAGSTHYKKPQMAGLLGLTNIAAIERAADSHPDLSELISAEDTSRERLQKLKSFSAGKFVQRWKELGQSLMETRPMSGSSSLSSKDREIIKEKFKYFNATLDELVAEHKALRITDSALRKQINNEIGFIAPIYYRFYDKYAEGSFSKHAYKYVKYNKKQIDEILSAL
ncbi:hypothetical protein CANCADRAFT_56113 [Tortispora caseinolytica NRRL Y-17796]|uniref:Exocyst complex protein EXO70 n=1 Tax=Tortispora caseinolytica NRRL Y-17796 TaxID=767744 RepID=A0A1E4TL32_9ASCO|nr:hypothetical protein CANCADRAFT_56113 [Tortispora caseinolytica NRRL Y-17796]